MSDFLCCYNDCLFTYLQVFSTRSHKFFLIFLLFADMLIYLLVLLGITMSQAQEKELRKRKIRLMLLIGFVAVGLVASILAAMFRAGVFAQMPASQLYGNWVEQGVPSYARDSFTISAGGIYTHGRLISTKFDFDGSQLSYKHGGTTYIYMVEDNDGAQLLRTKPTHYKSSFRKQ